MTSRHGILGRLRFRLENFGGIVAGESPPFLAFVDRAYMRDLGLGESPLWKSEDETIGVLSAPTEVHFAVTNSCSGNCPHCYMDGGREDDGELGTDEMKRALEVLAEVGVFHVAMGGGEALERPDVFELAEHARSLGLVPNLTISGRRLTPETARRMRVFGQVNVSLDGVEEYADTFRGPGTFCLADRALGMLLDADVPTGINCVLGRRNFEGLDDLFDYAARRGLDEIEFLRLKPAGRAGLVYELEKTTASQNELLVPRLAERSRRCGVTAKIDCSFVPMLCGHSVSRELLDALGTYGCEAGNILLGIRSNGRVNGCSFLDSGDMTVFDLPRALKDGSLARTHHWVVDAPEPCRACEYLQTCKGGCHAVSQYVTGRFDAPDPDCPRVLAYRRGGEGDRT